MYSTESKFPRVFIDLKLSLVELLPDKRMVGGSNPLRSIKQVECE